MSQNTRPSAVALSSDLPNSSGWDAETTMGTEFKHLQGKRVGLVVMSPYPYDPRPRRAAEALVGQGMSVDYICVADGQAPWYEKIGEMNVLRIPIVHSRGSKVAYAYEYSAFILVSSLILAIRLFLGKYDLVYINNMPDVLVVSALLPKLLGAKVILDLHDPMPELMTTIYTNDPNSGSVRFIKWLEKWSMARAHWVVTPNLACRRILASRSCAKEKIGVVMNSPDESIFPFHPARSRPWPNRSIVRPFIVMYHGSLVERNGVDLAIRAFARVRSRVSTAQLQIFGKMTPFLERVMRSCKDDGLARDVHYLGEKSLEEIVKAIDLCDVGIIPNHRSAFADINTPTRIFEYLALGKPVIAPRTQGIQDYFTDDSLLFFEAGEADELAERIEFVAFHPGEALCITERGQQVYIAHKWKQERQALLRIVGMLLQSDRSL